MNELTPCFYVALAIDGLMKGLWANSQMKYWCISISFKFSVNSTLLAISFSLLLIHKVQYIITALPMHFSWLSKDYYVCVVK